MNAARSDDTVHRMAQVIAASNLPLAHATAIRAMLAESFSAEQISAHLAEAINRARAHRTASSVLPPTWGHSSWPAALDVALALPGFLCDCGGEVVGLRIVAILATSCQGAVSAGI
jgi:hypothetical protein